MQPAIVIPEPEPPCDRRGASADGAYRALVERLSQQSVSSTSTPTRTSPGTTPSCAIDPDDPRWELARDRVLAPPPGIALSRRACARGSASTSSRPS